MELQSLFENNTNSFASKIKDSKYIEKPKTVVVKEKITDICEIIISKNELNYSILSSRDEKETFVREKKLEIASSLSLFNDENTKGSYIKKWKPSLIEKGLQSKNFISSILYMNIHYNINTVIYNKDKDKYYITTLNNSPKVVCSYENDSWCYVDNYDENKTSSEINELNEILMLDINTIFIKNQFLDSLSKYKLKELEELSKKNIK